MEASYSKKSTTFYDTYGCWFESCLRIIIYRVMNAQHYAEAAMDKIKIKQIAQGDAGDNKCLVKLLDHFKHTDPNGQHV